MTTFSILENSHTTNIFGIIIIKKTFTKTTAGPVVFGGLRAFSAPSFAFVVSRRSPLLAAMRWFASMVLDSLHRVLFYPAHMLFSSFHSFDAFILFTQLTV
jgi:hypothetical protein